MSLAQAFYRCTIGSIFAVTGFLLHIQLFAFAPERITPDGFFSVKKYLRGVLQ